MIKSTVVPWVVPNRSNEGQLHIADRGARLSTVTGITWLNDSLYLLAHQVGRMIALFDTKFGNQPIKCFDVPHLIDDITSRATGASTWEVTVSGCWDVVTTTFELALTGEPTLKTKSRRVHKDRTFSHGVRYFEDQLCIAFSSGRDPRVEIADQVYRLPIPWGARCICFDKFSGSYFAIANSNTPKQKQYTETSTSVWALKKSSPEWVMRFAIKGMHSDACEIYQNRIWFPDQRHDRVLGICLENKNKPIILSGNSFNFPHGLSISPSGTLAVTNYGSSSVVLLDLNEVILVNNKSH